MYIHLALELTIINEWMTFVWYKLYQCQKYKSYQNKNTEEFILQSQTLSYTAKFCLCN